MNPLNEHLKSYITVCFITGVIYAVVVGINQSASLCLADGVGYGIILFSAGIVLWNIYRFTGTVNDRSKYRIIVVVALTLTMSVFIIGIETLVAYLCSPSTFDAFVSTIPIRTFITYLICTIFYFFCKTFEGNRRTSADIFKKKPDGFVSNQLLGKSDTADTTSTTETPVIDRITVRSGSKIKIIPLDSILYIKADGDYISIRTTEGSWLKEQTMKYTEERLPISSFLRIHRSYIVNIHRINRLERYGEKQLVILSNNEKIKISVARYQILKQILGI